jgi:hypothetical protein
VRQTFRRNSLDSNASHPPSILGVCHAWSRVVPDIGLLVQSMRGQALPYGCGTNCRGRGRGRVWLNYWNKHGRNVWGGRRNSNVLTLFIVVPPAGFVECTVPSAVEGVTTEIRIFHNANIPPSAEKCHNITYNQQRFNCDPKATTSNLCVGGRFNDKLKKLVFDGTCS